MNLYTVVGVRHDTEETYIGHHEAPTAERACSQAQQAANDPDEPDEVGQPLRIHAVFQGWHNDLACQL